MTSIIDPFNNLLFGDKQKIKEETAEKELPTKKESEKEPFVTTPNVESEIYQYKEENTSEEINDSDIYQYKEDILNEEYAISQEGPIIIKNILKEYSTKIDAIEEFLVLKKVSPVAPDYKTSSQTVTIKENKYILEDPHLLHGINRILLKLEDFALVEHSLKKSADILDHAYLKEVYKTQPEFKNTLLKKIPTIYYSKIITRVLGFLVTKEILYNKTAAFNITKNVFMQQIGEQFIETFMQLNCTHIEKKVEDSLTAELTEYYPKTKAELKIEFKDNREPTLKKYPEEIKKMIDDYIEVTLFTPSTEEALRKYETAMHNMNKAKLHVGSEIVAWLIKINLFEEFTDRYNVPTMRFTDRQNITLFVAASHYKPKISKINFPTMYTHKINESFNIEVNLNMEQIPNRSYVHITPTPALTAILNTSSETPMCIDKTQLDAFIRYCGDVISNIDNTSVEVIAFCNIVYDIDFNHLLENNADIGLVKDILRYSLNITRYYDESIQKRIVDNLACQRTYNKISSFKYYLKGLLIDAKLYSHFGYFYIPKYLTSTGRMFSKPFFLQLQGNKLALAFIKFKEQIFTKEKYDTFLGIVAKNFPLLKTDTPHLKTYESFLNLTYNRFIKYIESYLKPNTILDTYPDKGDYKSQTTWLLQNVKKPRDVLFVQSLTKIIARLLYEQKLCLSFWKHHDSLSRTLAL